MNLETAIMHLKNKIERYKEDDQMSAELLETYGQFHSWLSELLRYRLARSEILNEIESTEDCDRDWVIKLLAAEADDWQLNDIIP